MEQEMQKLKAAIQNDNFGNIRDSIMSIACHAITNYTDVLLYTALEMIYNMTTFVNELEDCMKPRE